MAKKITLYEPTMCCSSGVCGPNPDQALISLQDTIDKAKARGIETGVYYPLPLHLQELYLDMGLGTGSFPEAERAAAEVLSLPIFPEMGDDQVETVAAVIRTFYAA